jgi:3-methyladenine DNA glycosylase AlkD
MQTTADVLAQLEADGTEQNRKIYQRHGSGLLLYGVSYANLNTFKKRVKVNHDIAKDLWETGNHDARIFALMIADPKQADDDLLENWAQNLDNYMVAGAFAGYVGNTAFAHEKMLQWTQSDDEWIGAVGWDLLGHLAMKDKSLDNSFFQSYLPIIERDIHSRKNRTRYSMNNALIAIGIRNDDLEEAATAAAQQIGVVTVDHGKTSCKTPDAAPYIQKTNARRRKKAKAR